MILPFADYERIHLMVKAVLDSENAKTAFACSFFALAGAGILFTHYGIRARPIFGAALLLLNEESKDILTYGRMDGAAIASDENHFHAWIDTGSHVIDFMAPLYEDAMSSKGYEIKIPQRMFQRPKENLVQSIFDLKSMGDCHLQPNLALTQNMIKNYLHEPIYRNIIEVSTKLYRKPPMHLPDLIMTNRDGMPRRIVLDPSTITGSW
jgi:hypothetical protein